MTNRGSTGLGRMLAAGLCVAIGAIAPAAAGPLNKQWVDLESKWVAHLDMEAAMASNFGQRFHQMYHDALADADRSVQTMLSNAGVDLTRDIRGITVYGLDASEQKGVVVIHGTKSLERLLDELASEVPEFKRGVGEDATMFSWLDAGKTKYGRLRPGPVEGERLFILAPGRDELRRCEEIMSGRLPSIAQAEVAPMSNSPGAGSILFVAAQGMNADDKKQAKGEAGLLARLTSTLAIDLGEAGDKAYAEVAVTSRVEREADAMVQIMHGMLAMAQVSAVSEPDYERFAAVLDQVRISKEGRHVMVRVQTDSSVVLEAMSGISGLGLNCDLPEDGGEVKGVPAKAP